MTKTYTLLTRRLKTGIKTAWRDSGVGAEAFNFKKVHSEEYEAFRHAAIEDIEARIKNNSEISVEDE